MLLFMIFLIIINDINIYFNEHNNNNINCT